MKRHLSLINLLIIGTLLVYAAEPKREFRATWIATVSCIDWPSTRGTTAAAIQSQKNEMLAIFNALASTNLNATFLQVRPASDAFYTSSREPWSQWLSGTRGTYPGWDPLAFAVEEAHKRGLELHCWINPYRYEINNQHNTYPATDPIRQNHPDWILDFDNGSFNGTLLDPGNPAVRQYITEVIAEIVTNYDIDGVIFDDYFYPYGGTTSEDASSVAAYKPASQSVSDWRRWNVDKTVEMVYDTIQACKPWVRFGIGPFGIWSTSKSAADKYGISLPQGITGTDAYNSLYCNTLEWMKQGTVDYVSPQLYWSTASSGQDYDVLSKWWSDMALHFTNLQSGGKKIHFWPSVAIYRLNTSSGGFNTTGTNEMNLEIDDNRAFDQLDAPGIVYYNTTYYRQWAYTITKMKQKTLAPAMDWKSAPQQGTPTNVRVANGTLSWDHSTGDRFSVYVYPKGIYPDIASSGEYLNRIVYGKTLDISDIDSLSDKTIAVCAYDRYGNEFAPSFYNKADVEERDTIDIHVTGINLRVTQKSLNKGDSVELKPIVSPSNADVKTVVWSSDNEEVATVRGTTGAYGMVSALEPGTCTVTVRTLDGGHSASCEITVIGTPDPPVTGLEETDISKRAKVVMDGGNAYIERDGERYSINGTKL